MGKKNMPSCKGMALLLEKGLIFSLAGTTRQVKRDCLCALSDSVVKYLFNMGETKLKKLRHCI